MTAPLYSQEGFRFRDDISDLAVFSELENVDHAHEREKNFRIRIEIENTNNRSGGGGHGFEIWAQRNGAGGYAQITGATTYIQVASTIHYADGDADNTDRLATSSASFDEGVLDETGVESVSIGSNNHAEIEFCLVLTAASGAGDYFDIRVYDEGSPLNNYADTPRITANAIKSFEGSSAGVGSAEADFTVIAPPIPGNIITTDGLGTGAHYHGGPVIDSDGNLYVAIIRQAAAPEIAMFKSDDNGDTWVEQDTSNRPTNGASSINSLVVYPVVVSDGTDEWIYIATFVSAEDVYFHIFNPSTHTTDADAWHATIVDILAASHTATGTEREVWISIGDTYQDILIVHADDIAGTNENCAYSYSTNQGVDWTEDEALDDGSDSFDNLAQWAGYGPRSSKVFVAWKRDDTSELYYRSLTDVEQSPSGHTDLCDFTHTVDNYTSRFVVYDQGAEEHLVMVELDDATPPKARSVHMIDEGSPEASKQITATGIHVFGSVSSPSMSLCFDGSTVYFVFADSVTQDIYVTKNFNNETSWESEVEVGDGVDAQCISAQVYELDGKVYLGIVYDNNTETDTFRFLAYYLYTPFAGSSQGQATAVASTLDIGAPNVTFAGASAGVATAVATLEMTRVFSPATSAGQATAQATLIAIRTLSTVSAGQATAEATLIAIRTFTTISTGQATAEATMTPERVFAVGESAGQATAQAGLSLTLAYQATATGQATAEATMTPERTFESVSAGQATAQSWLQLTLALQAASAGQATAEADFSVTGTKIFAGASAGQATAEAWLQITLAFQATSAGQATAQGTLTIEGQDIDFLGASAGQATAEAWLQLTLAFQTMAAGQATAEATLAVGQTKLFAGASAGQAAAAAWLQLALAFQAVSTGQATAVATLELTGTIDFAGASAGQASAQATTILILGFQATSTGQATAQATMIVIRTFAGTSDGQASTVATMIFIKTFTGASAGSSTAVASMTFIKTFAGASAGSSTAEATMIRELALYGISAGQATALANLNLTLALFGTSAGQASAEAELNVIALALETLLRYLVVSNDRRENSVSGDLRYTEVQSDEREVDIE